MTQLHRSARPGPTAVLAALALTLPACSGGASDSTGVQPDSTAVAVVSIIPTSLTLQVGQSMVSPGGAHTCGLTMTGLAYCWGSNSDGQLGTGNSLYPHGSAPVLAP